MVHLSYWDVSPDKQISYVITPCWSIDVNTSSILHSWLKHWCHSFSQLWCHLEFPALRSIASGWTLMSPRVPCPPCQSIDVTSTFITSFSEQWCHLEFPDLLLIALMWPRVPRPLVFKACKFQTNPAMFQIIARNRDLHITNPPEQEVSVSNGTLTAHTTNPPE